MTRRLFLTLMAAESLLLPAYADDTPSWKATGTLLEACTCAVPCSCNFGEGPSPHHYCHALYAYRLEKAIYGGVDLSGLIVAGADADKGGIGFLDERATAEQRPHLEKLARVIFAQGGPSSGKRRFLPAKITHEVKGNDLRLAIAGYGGFTAKVIIGRDGKSPVVVENNTIWPIPRATKAKTITFAFREKDTGSIDSEGSNANYGAFTLGNQNP